MSENVNYKPGKMSPLAKIDLYLLRREREDWINRIPPGSMVCHKDYPNITGKTRHQSGIYKGFLMEKAVEVDIDDPQLALRTNKELAITPDISIGLWPLNKTVLIKK